MKNNLNTNYIWSISYKKTINTDISNLWALISKPSNLELFHPFCSINQVIKWPGKGSIDKIIYYNGLTLERYFINWIDNKGYDLLIGEKNGPKSLVIWRLKKINPNKSSIKIKIYPHQFNDKSSLFNFLKFYLIVYPIIKKYLRQVLNGLHWHIKTGNKISKNMFGNNTYFSIK